MSASSAHGWLLSSFGGEHLRWQLQVRETAMLRRNWPEWRAAMAAACRVSLMHAVDDSQSR